MASGNTVEVVGNVTRDPETRLSNSGTAVVKFGLAYNHRKFNSSTNEWDEEVSFFDVTAFGDLGTNVAESIHKGDRVLVNGRLKQSSWDADDGTKRTRVEIIADEIGPSLRWATASITKAESSKGRGSAPAASADADEEPF